MRNSGQSCGLPAALEVDPNNSDALAGDAYAYTLEFVFGSRNSETDYDTKILGTADRAITLDRDNIQAYLAKSFYLLVSRRPSDALRAANAGLAIDANSASLLATRSIAETYLHQFKQEVRCAASDEPKSARSGVEPMA